MARVQYTILNISQECFLLGYALHYYTMAFQNHLSCTFHYFMYLAKVVPCVFKAHTSHSLCPCYGNF